MKCGKMPELHFTMMSPLTVSSMTGAPRYYALDSLRAAMMLICVVFHSALSYMVTPVAGIWPFKDPHTHPLFDLLVLFLHTFQMPVFFVMAGFSGASLLERVGVREFVTNRCKRILLPLLVGWSLLFPLVASISLYVNPGVSSDPEMFHLSLIHLWFLYQLLLFYTAMLFCLWCGRHLSGKAKVILSNAAHRAHRVFRMALSSLTGVAVFALPTMMVFCGTRTGVLETSAVLLPPVHVLAAHGLTFLFGWILYRHRDLLPLFTVRPWLHIAMGLLLCFPVYLIAFFRVAHTTPNGIHLTQPSYLLAVASGSMTTWLLIFGFIGLALRYLDRPIKIVCYLSNASYWIYLVHLPFTIWLPGLLAPLPLPALLKFFVVLGTTLVVTVLLYHYAVRSTRLGFFLNGKIYPARSMKGFRLLITGRGLAS